MSRTPGMNVPQCRFCHCTETSPCLTESGDTCGWATRQRDVCTARGCLIAFDRERKGMRRRKEAQRKVLVQPIREAFDRADVERRRKREENARRAKGKRTGGVA